MNARIEPPKGRQRGKLPRSPWPFAIAGVFAIFISGMAVWIGFAVQQNMDLVREDYYEEQVRYQRQIDRMKRTAPVLREIAAAYDSAAQTVSVTLPAEHVRGGIAGRIQMYRPSNARLDCEMELALGGGGNQILDVRSLAPGFWKLRLFWTAAGEDYYFEQPLVIVGEKGSL